MKEDQIEALISGLKQINHNLALIGQKENQLTEEVTHMRGGIHSVTEHMKRLTPYFEQLVHASSPQTTPSLGISHPVENVLPPDLPESSRHEYSAGFNLEPPVNKPQELPIIEQSTLSEQHSCTLERTLANYSGNSSYTHSPESASLFGGREGLNFEMQFGIKWFSWLGIIVLLIGLAMAISYTFPNFPKEMKILTGIILSLGLYGTGHWLHRQTAFLGRILQGGGLSLGYLSLFAVFFIPDVQLMNAPGFGLFCLLSYVVGILFLAHRLNSQTVAVLSLLYGYYTAGYAENTMIAYCSAGIISLATIGVAKLHKDWQIVAKVNLLGAFCTYMFWFRKMPNDVLLGQVYLVFSFLLFHCVSLVRANRGDFALNVINLVGFFILFKSTQPELLPFGLFELLLFGVQLGSFFIVNALRPDEKEEPLSISLLISSLICGCLGFLRIFDAQIISSVMVAVALGMGMFSTISIYSTILVASSYITFLVSFCTLVIAWNQLPQQAALLSVIWLNLCAFILEAVIFRAHEKSVRMIVTCLPVFTLWIAINQFVPSYWRTVSLVFTGLILLISGFGLHRQFYRWMGVGWILGLGGLSLLGDLVTLSTGYKIILFLVLGGVLLGSSYLYTKMEKRLKKEDRKSFD